MKLLYSFSLLLLINTSLVAQSLTASSAPQIGDKAVDVSLDTTNLTMASGGSGGTGQTWDFSSATMTSAKDSDNYVAPSSTPFASNFPTANLVEVYNHDSSFTYYQSTSTGVVTLGDASMTNAGGGIIANIINKYPEFNITYPLNYNTWQTSSFTGISITSVFGTTDTSYVTGSDSIMIDGTGTLITPDGITYTNALRLRIIENIYDSSAISGSTDYTITYSRTDGYSYTINNQFGATIAISIGSSNIYTYTAGTGGSWGTPTISKEFDYYIPQSSVTGIAKSAASAGIMVYPNPAKDVVTVNFNGTNCSSARLTDIAGREVLTSADGAIAINGQNATMNVSGLTKGIYLLQLNGNGIPTVQKVAVE